MEPQPIVFDGPKRRFSAVALAAIIFGSVLMLGLFYFFVIAPTFFSSAEELAPPLARALPQTATPAVVPSPYPSPTSPPVETFEVFEAKDPFRPLVVAGAPASSGSGSGTSGTTGSTGSTGSGSGAAGSTGSGSGAAGGAAPTGGQRIQLLDVFTDKGATKAQIKVGSTVFTVSVGEVFASNFKLISISGTCATLLHGDDKFTLCEGEEVFK
ncbi:MAG: hypothetical protein ABIS18_03760 [Actinomycetota bacterium]